jgi:hypothetical protein
MGDAQLEHSSKYMGAMLVACREKFLI